MRLADIILEHALVSELAVDVIPTLLAALESIRAALWFRLLTGGAPQVHSGGRPGELLTVREAADLMKLRPQYVYELVRQGRLPAVREGKYVRIPRKGLEEWTREKTSESRR
jgi:excisionase family DNA binding protein